MDTNNLIQRDLNTLWHPFTQMTDCDILPPVLIERSKGIKLFSSDESFYYDTISSWWCNIHGHNHPKIVAAIKAQMDKLDHVLFAGFTHRGAIELAERLVDITPENLKRVFYSDNGSTSVEVAMKMSLQYWRNTGQSEKTKFAHLDCGYHGDTVGAMSVSGRGIFNRAFEPMMMDTVAIKTPYCYRCPFGQSKDNCQFQCADACEKVLAENADKLAAVIIEPLLMGAGGMIIYPAEFLIRLAAAAKNHDVHLIVDEIATGFGRTGKMFACEHADIKPDFMCVSKGLTSGTLPIAATLTTSEIFDAFCDDYEKYKTLYHGHTFTANPIGCAAALACMDIFEDEDTLKTTQPKIAKLAASVKKISSLECVGDIRTLGMVAAIELVSGRQTKSGFDTSERLGQRIFREGLKHQLILRPLGDTIYFYLPLCTTEAEIEMITERTFDILSRLDELPAWK